jgi:hypothetical protein
VPFVATNFNAQHAHTARQPIVIANTEYRSPFDSTPPKMHTSDATTKYPVPNKNSPTTDHAKMFNIVLIVMFTPKPLPGSGLVGDGLVGIRGFAIYATGLNVCLSKSASIAATLSCRTAIASRISRFCSSADFPSSMASTASNSSRCTWPTDGSFM